MSKTLTFSNLSITKKIHTITIIATVMLLTILFNSYSTLQDNERSLDELSSHSYQKVLLTSENKYLLEKLDEQYTQAVTFGDDELLDKTNETGASIKTNLMTLKEFDDGAHFEQQMTLLAAYQRVAYRIANGMIEGSADFSKIQQEAQNKTNKYNQLLASFDNEKTRADAYFSALVIETKARSQSSLFVNVGVIISALFMIVLLAFYIANAIAKSAKEVAHSLADLADGNGRLSSQLVVHSDDEIGAVSKHFNGFIGLLKGSVENVISVVSPLMESSTRLVQGMELAESSTNKQSHDAEIVQQSMEEMKLSVSDISQSAAHAAEAAKLAEQEVEISMAQIKQSMQESSQLSMEIDTAAATIERLANDTQNVGNILNVITSIAEQTNLLALNAAIEAARAGEQGRGFAVVADEVRELASRTAKSTNEIRELLTALTSAAGESVSAMNHAMEKARNNAIAAEQTGESVEKISGQILSINGMNAQIAAATEEQTSVAAMVVENVSNMHESFNSTLESLTQVREVAGDLHGLSDELLAATAKFKV